MSSSYCPGKGTLSPSGEGGEGVWPSSEPASDARSLASFLACFSARRSRSLLSRFSFAIVVFLLPLEAIVRPSQIEVMRLSRADGRASQVPARTTEGPRAAPPAQLG